MVRWFSYISRYDPLAINFVLDTAQFNHFNSSCVMLPTAELKSVFSTFEWCNFALSLHSQHGGAWQYDLFPCVTDADYNNHFDYLHTTFIYYYSSLYNRVVVCYYERYTEIFKDITGARVAHFVFRRVIVGEFEDDNNHYDSFFGRFNLRTRRYLLDKIVRDGIVTENNSFDYSIFYVRSFYKVYYFDCINLDFEFTQVYRLLGFGGVSIPNSVDSLSNVKNAMYDFKNDFNIDHYKVLIHYLDCDLVCSLMSISFEKSICFSFESRFIMPQGTYHMNFLSFVFFLEFFYTFMDIMINKVYIFDSDNFDTLYSLCMVWFVSVLYCDDTAILREFCLASAQFWKCQNFDYTMRNVIDNLLLGIKDNVFELLRDWIDLDYVNRSGLLHLLHWIALRRVPSKASRLVGKFDKFEGASFCECVSRYFGKVKFSGVGKSGKFSAVTILGAPRVRNVRYFTCILKIMCAWESSKDCMVTRSLKLFNKIMSATCVYNHCNVDFSVMLWFANKDNCPNSHSFNFGKTVLMHRKVYQHKRIAQRNNVLKFVTYDEEFITDTVRLKSFGFKNDRILAPRKSNVCVVLPRKKK